MGVVATPDGKKVYVAKANVYVANGNYNCDGTVSVIDTAKNQVTDTVNVGNNPIAFGQFVGQPPFTITWSNPVAITYGTPLSDTQLDAKATDPTTGNPVTVNFVYTDETAAVDTAQTVLNVGTHTLTATFTPDDSTDYAGGGTVKNSITVAQATPKIVLTPTRRIQQMIAFIQCITTSDDLD